MTALSLGFNNDTLQHNMPYNLVVVSLFEVSVMGHVGSPRSVLDFENGLLMLVLSHIGL